MTFPAPGILGASRRGAFGVAALRRDAPRSPGRLHVIAARDDSAGEVPPSGAAQAVPGSRRQRERAFRRAERAMELRAQPAAVLLGQAHAERAGRPDSGREAGPEVVEVVV